MAAIQSQVPAKPGTACLGCRRRKLKCTRDEQGCTNCAKGDLPCVYPQPETGVKRKRGPYKKDKPPRERHLEHLVKYLEPGGLANGSSNGGGPRSGSDLQDAVAGSHLGLLAESASERRGTQSEDLVKDALIALTKSTVSERESTTESARYSCVDTGVQHESQAPASRHPSARRILEYWQLFLTRVDPLTKVIHCPTFLKNLLVAIDSPHELDPATEILLVSIYYIVVSTCTANETRRRFGESRASLLQQYGHIIEPALAEYYGMPVLEHVQAVILYMIAVRRQDDGASVSTLFGLAVRMAQMMSLHQDPGKSCKPYVAELRRRAWYHICALESRAAEEHGTRTKSVMENSDVRFPANANDVDLDPRATEPPKPSKGRTDVSWVLMRWESQRLVYSIARVKRKRGPDGQPLPQEIMLSEQRSTLVDIQGRIETDYVQHMDRSRPLDLLGLAFWDVISRKAKRMVDHPFSQIPTKDMSNEERYELLQSSVVIISITHMLAVDSRVDSWQWFARGYMQWHSLAIVVAELGRIKNKEFCYSAWAVLDPILADWERLYRMKRGEPAWDHVHALISRAKQMRVQTDTLDQPIPHAQARHLQPMKRSPAATASALIAPSPFSPDQYTTPTQSLPDLAKVVLPYYSSTGTPQQESTPLSMDEQIFPQQQALPFAPNVWDFGSDLGSFDGLDQIDFQAFDAVFGGDGWEFPSPLGGIDGLGIEHDMGPQALG